MLGIVPDSIYDQEINSLVDSTGNGNGKGDSTDNSIDKNQEPVARIIDKETPGRKENDNNVPQELRKVIAEEHLVNGRKSAIALANSLGISHDSADAYAKGATSLATYNQPNLELKSHLDKVKERITKKASRKLLGALDSITLEKLEEVKPRDAAGIAKDMSAIIKNMEPEKEVSRNIGPNFVFYAPRPRDESAFDVIDVKE